PSKADEWDKSMEQMLCSVLRGSTREELAKMEENFTAAIKPRVEAAHAEGVSLGTKYWWEVYVGGCPVLREEKDRHRQVLAELCKDTARVLTPDQVGSTVLKCFPQGTGRKQRADIVLFYKDHYEGIRTWLAGYNVAWDPAAFPSLKLVDRDGIIVAC